MDMQMVCNFYFHKNTAISSLFLGLGLEYGLHECLYLKAKWFPYSLQTRNQGTPSDSGCWFKFSVPVCHLWSWSDKSPHKNSITTEIDHNENISKPGIMTHINSELLISLEGNILLCLLHHNEGLLPHPCLHCEPWHKPSLDSHSHDQ